MAADPTGCLQVASLQGYLLRNKTRPRECVEEVTNWCVSEQRRRVGPESANRVWQGEGGTRDTG